MQCIYYLLEATKYSNYELVLSKIHLYLIINFIALYHIVNTDKNWNQIPFIIYFCRKSSLHTSDTLRSHTFGTVARFCSTSKWFECFCSQHLDLFTQSQKSIASAAFSLSFGIFSTVCSLCAVQYSWNSQLLKLLLWLGGIGSTLFWHRLPVDLQM